MLYLLNKNTKITGPIYERITRFEIHEPSPLENSRKITSLYYQQDTREFPQK